jgi:hypothetical protein
VNLRLARVFHLRRVHPRAASLRLALIFIPLRAHPVTVNRRIARVFHRHRASPVAFNFMTSPSETLTGEPSQSQSIWPSTSHSNSSESTISPSLSPPMSHSNCSEPTISSHLLPLRAHPVTVNLRVARVFHRHRASLVALNLWQALQEPGRESQLSLQAFDPRRVSPRAACLRSARVFHFRRVTPRGESTVLALTYTVLTLTLFSWNPVLIRHLVLLGFCVRTIA